MNNRYTIENKDNIIVIKNAKNFVLTDIFDCGQCFRFNKRDDGSYYGVAHGKYIEIYQEQDEIFIKNINADDFENLWKDFFDLDFDYTDCIKDFPADNVLITAAEFASGIRILHQEHWEALCSFIISQNNNIPRIKKIIEALSQRCGEPIELCDEAKKHISGVSSLCAFPSADAIYELGIDGLNELKTGFRSKYIYDAVSRARDGSLSIDRIRDEADIDRSIEMLCEVKGIGNKVASCALLFGFEKYNAFPIDVWMKRVAQKYFSELGDSLSWRTFGNYAGIAQQYLFYYERWNRD
jgi:N-glycosylase/DNA lyase